LPQCSKCSNTNPVGALFCGKCGSKLDSSAPDFPVSQTAESTENSIFEDNFLEYLSPEFDIKISYPATWTMMDNDLVDRNTKVIFYSPREDPSDTYFDCLGIAIQENYMMDLQHFVDGNIQNLRQTNPDFVLVESLPTTLSCIPAHKLEYTENGFKTLCVVAIKDNKVYYLIYRAQIPKYIKFLSIVEQMVASFDFIR